MTTGLHRQASLKLAAIVREGASRWRLSCGARAWEPVVLRGGPSACAGLNDSFKDRSGSGVRVGGRRRHRLPPAKTAIGGLEITAAKPTLACCDWLRISEMGTLLNLNK